MLSERFNWDRLRVFRVVADAQSMTAAAKTLGESPPTVSRRINDLERELGTSLFRRSKRGVQLTPAGIKLLDLVQSMQLLVDDVSCQVAESDQTATGAIKIKAGDGLGPYWLASQLPAFHQSVPGVQIELEIGLAKNEVVDREADIAIVYEKPTHPEIISQNLGMLHYMCFASEHYIAERGQPRTLFEFDSHKLLMHSDYVHQMERWSKSLQELKTFIDYSTITNSGTALVSLCTNGGGIAVLPSYFSALEKKLIPMDLPTLAPIRFWLTYTERVRRNPAGIAAIEWLKSIFDSSQHPWFSQDFVHPKDIAPITDAMSAENDALSV